jgi:hypothetical protein
MINDLVYDDYAMLNAREEHLVLLRDLADFIHEQGYRNRSIDIFERYKDLDYGLSSYWRGKILWPHVSFLTHTNDTVITVDINGFFVGQYYHIPFDGWPEFAVVNLMRDLNHYFRDYFKPR